MKINFLFAILLFSPLFLTAQKFTLRGTVSDTASEPLTGCTVMLLQAKDSSLVAFTRSDEKGVFEMKGVSAGTYQVRLSFFGYLNLQKNVSLSGEGRVVDLGKLNMLVKPTVLQGVDVVGQANPIVIKNDTIEYNAGSFYTKPNATVEDLLKKLPGVEVEKDGTIRAQGEQVRSVTVDGKKFFGDDPKVATKNLPADAIDKVQVYDKKSEQAQFSGVDDGQKQKAINLELKEDKKNGWFGKMMAGGGSDLKETDNQGRFEGRVNLNKFGPKQQISVLGLGNNVNEPGFSFQEYMDFSGGSRSMMSGGGMMRLSFDADDMSVPMDFGDRDGFLRTFAGGVNFNREYGKKNKGDLNGSYFFNQPNRQYQRNINRETFLPTTSFTTTEETTQETQADNHRISLTIDQKVDSFNSIQLTSNLTASETFGSSKTSTLTSGSFNRAQNGGERTAESESNRVNWRGNLLWRHKFAKKGRSFSANFNSGIDNNDAESNSFAENRFYDDGNEVRLRDTIAQRQRNETERLNWGARATYTEPFGKKRYLELNYQYSLADNRNNREVFDRSEQREVFDPKLSNAFDNHFAYHRGGAGFRMNRKTWNGSLGLNAQTAELSGKVISGTGQPVSKRYNNLLPRLDMEYLFTQSRRVNLSYNTDIMPPTVQQLQPIPDISDPLNIIEGNPELKPEYQHSGNLNFSAFNPVTMRSLFIGAFVNYTTDAIVNAQYVDSLLVRRYKPVNAASQANVYFNAGYGLPVRKWKSRFHMNLSNNLTSGQNFVNGNENRTNTYVVGASASWDFNPTDKFNFNASVRRDWNKTTYSVDKNFNQQYLTYTYSGEMFAELPKGFALNTSLNVVSNVGWTDGFNQTIPIWNLSVSKFFLKANRGELTLAARDLLNRNVGLNRTANLNYIQDERIASLGRYVTLRFTYSLNSMGGRGAQPGGMRIMIRR